MNPFKIALLGCVLVCGAGHPPARAAQPVSLDIAAQPIGDALNELARQTGLQVVLYSELETGVQAPAVRGGMTADEALERLLAGTGLKHRFLDDKTVMVISASDPKGKHTAGTSLPGSMRLAQTEGTQRTDSTAAGAGGGASPDSQARGRSDDDLQEVMVTAQKRTESAASVPISMTVLSADKLETLRVQGLDDFVFNIPNATYTSTGVTSPRVVMRGVNNGGGQYAPIAVTVDDSGYGSVDERPILSSQVFDIERIEVLRGPQGTLTGSSSLGGTLNIITAQPKMDALELKATVDYSRFDSALHKAVINIPLSDTLAVRTVAYTFDSDGAVRNVGPGGGTSSKNHYGARLSALWNATERLKIAAAFSYEEQRYGLDDGLYLDRHFGGEAGKAAAIATLESLGGQYRDVAVDFIGDAGTDGGQVKLDDPDRTDLTHIMGSLRATYDLGTSAVDLIYGHFQYDELGSQDLDRSEFAVQRTHYFVHNYANSVELRLSSKRESPFNWVLGAVHIKDRVPQGGRYSEGDGALAGSYPFFINFLTDRSIETSAVFANLFWDITDRWHLSAGARYTDLKNAYGDAVSLVDGQYFEVVNLVRSKLNEFDPRIALSWDLNADTMLYGQFSTGFRPGYGNNPLAVGPHPTEQGVIDVPATVDNEYLKNYEVGLKGRLGRRLSYSLAAFYMDYQDLQIRGPAILDPDYPYDFDVNGGKGSARGIELETTARLSEHWTLDGGVGYVDTQIDGFGSVERTKIPGIRPWTLNATATYERAINDEYRGQLRIGYKWQDSAFGSTSHEPVWEMPEFSVVDVSLGIATDRWSLTAYAENVTDEVYWVGITGGSDIRGTRAIFIPRTFGLRFGYSFKSTR